MRISFILLVLLVIGKASFGQNTEIFDRVSTPSLLMEDGISRKGMDLQKFVESIYINASLLYNNSLPSLKSGEYYVIIDKRDTTQTVRSMTSDLKGLSVENLEELSYKKSLGSDVIHGTFGRLFGMVTIKLKE
ncbi:hypothetical protein [Sphingobacterium sp.]|uniref:hypothetical protein n=1 Tax=Sphingobacterium sp. TaxID=341027 RepID=UPI0028A8576B|nr:hypothetical protein [Sphingobacterium sp.]